MSGYRDDREALRAQLESLRSELASLRGGGAPGESMAERIAAIAVRVDGALEQVNADRELLRELAVSIAALRGEVAVPQSPPREPEAPAKPLASSVRRVIIAVVALHVLAVAIGFWFLSQDAPAKRWTPPPPPSPVANIPGMPHAVDPLRLYDRAAALAPGKDLTEIRLEYVASDGTVDLDSPHYRGSIAFRFARLPPEPPVDPTRPFGAPPPPPTPFEITLVEVTKSSIDVSPVSYANRYNNEPVPKPTCTTAQVWAAAHAEGAPNGVATLTYHHRHDEELPVWDFEIPFTLYKYWIGDPECHVFKGTHRDGHF